MKTEKFSKRLTDWISKHNLKIFPNSLFKSEIEDRNPMVDIVKYQLTSFTPTLKNSESVIIKNTLEYNLEKTRTLLKEKNELEAMNRLN